MCARVKSDGSAMPGSWLGIKTKTGIQTSMYGFGNGQWYNSRWESIETTWKEFNRNRGILNVDSFWEGKGCFQRKDGRDFDIGVILNNSREFSIITTVPNEVIRPYHGRMPLCLDKESVEEFLEGSMNVKQLDTGLYVLANKIAA